MKRKSVFTILFIVFAINAFAKESKPIRQLREDFLSWKFGMFIHFNMATFNEREWANGHEDPATFAPKKLDCSQWAEIAKMAQMQYAVLTVKHTGGWCLWDSDYTDTHDVTAFQNYRDGKGDIVQEYVDAFRKQGLKIGLYYCFPGDYTGRLGNPPLEKNHKDLHGLPPEARGDYAGFIKKQLTELLTRYGNIDLLWIDQYRNPYTRKNWQDIRKHIKSLQPNCLIVANNSLDFKETDIHSYEYPWLKTKRPDEALPPEDNPNPAEVCDVLGPAWFWKQKENKTNLKSAQEVVDMLQLCNNRNANYLLNVAPDTSGLIPTHSFYRLQNVSNLLSAKTQSDDQSSLIIDEARTLGSIDLARFSLGQGGMSARPMFADQIDELKAINPPTIRFFIQEFYNLLPALDTYNWSSLDSTLDVIVATGASPIPAICFKPPVLYPEVNQDITAPNSWAAWDTLVYKLVRHCLEKNYGIEYWEIGNEVDIGVRGGTPFRCTPKSYLEWYTHTANAIKKADPAAKVGGPALCCPYDGPIGRALIRHCANGNAPLDFYSWHAYTGKWGSTLHVKSMLAKYPSLSHVETLITEWNVSLSPTPDNVRCAFCLESMRWYWLEGTDITSYYHIRDWPVSENEFRYIVSDCSRLLRRWEGTTPRFGIWDFDGNKTPIYYVFFWMGKMKGMEISSISTTRDIKSWAVKNGNSTYAIFWNYGEDTTYNTEIELPSTTSGNFTLKKLDYQNVRDKVLRTGSVSGLSTDPLRITLDRYDIAFLEILH